ncbi:MAG: hypothetical protein JKY80_00230 [Mariprofundaceae bacterium]|nr:hypothetical protein [Mariprofundaceae bacterium]
MSDHNVTITDIKMPFFSMVIFMVKAAIASIPAIIILSVIASLTFTVLGMAFGSGNVSGHFTQQNF